mgnify:CR=1 FL=1
MVMLIHLVYILLLHLTRFADSASNGDEAWNSAQRLLGKLPIPQDLRRSNALEYDPFANFADDRIRLTIPMDYYEGQREREYYKFWQDSITEAQMEFYQLLQHASLEGSHQSDAHWVLKDMFLYGKHCFPHNKTLAHYHLEKFNQLTEGKNSTALFELSVMYSTGFFGTIEKDTAKALIYLQESARLENLQAKQALAYRYDRGVDLIEDKSKSLILYESIANTLRSKYSYEEWFINFPIIESYNVQIPDLTGEGLMGSQRIHHQSSAKRLTKKKPKEVESLFPSSGNGFAEYDEFSIYQQEDDFETDKISDIYYVALNNFYGSYTILRNPEASASILNLTYAKYIDKVSTMELFSKFYFSLCVELLGIHYLRGEGVERDIDLAEKYFKQAAILNEAVKGHNSANEYLGVIAQYYRNDPNRALEFYKKQTIFNNGLGSDKFHLWKLGCDNPSLLREDEIKDALDRSVGMGHIPSYFENAKQSIREHTTYNYNYPLENYKEFVESNEQYMAPYLKDAFLALLRGESEVALWYYSMAAEQGYLNAQVSAAWIMYQPNRLFEDPPNIPEARWQTALRYYLLAAQQGSIDSATVAGNMYFEVGEYKKTVELYMKHQRYFFNKHRTYFSYSSPNIWNLGYMYEHGLGVEQDFHLAKSLYERHLPDSLALKLTLLKLYVHWILSWTSKKFASLNISKPHRSRSSDWTNLFYKKRISSKHVREGPRNGPKTSLLKTVGNIKWLKKVTKFINWVIFDMNEDLLMIIITLGIILGSFIVTFFRGNLNIRVNGVPIRRNNNNDGDGDANLDAEAPGGDLNIMFFAI